MISVERYSPYSTAGKPSLSRAFHSCRVHLSVFNRIWAHLDVHGHWARALTKFVKPRSAIATCTPEAPTLPAAVWIVDPPIKTFSVEAHWVRHAHQDHLTVFEGDKTVLELGGRYRHVALEFGTSSKPGPGYLCNVQPSGQ
jgi:hypothetical protein